MSIVPLVKATLYGPSVEKNTVLDGLQKLGCMHLTDLSLGSTEEREAPGSSTYAREALQFLQDSPVRRRGLRSGRNVDLQMVVRDTIEVRDRSKMLADEFAQLHRWIADLEPWGDFELPEWAHQGDLRLWFYVVPNHKISVIQAIDLPWRVVARDGRFSYVVIVAADPPSGMPVAPVTLQPRSLSTLRSRLDEVEREMEELDYRRIGLTLYIRMLRQYLDEADDCAARQQAERKTLEREQVFAVQGWAPRERVEAMKSFASDRRLAITIEAPGPKDTPPTLLQNPSALRGGESMTMFYKTPGYSMWDPSKPVFFAFALFFGMIFSDAGYGLLLGILLLAIWKRLGRSENGGAMRGVLSALVISSVAYGVLVGSYFGWTPPEGSHLGTLRLLDVNDRGLLMLISISIGIVHLTCANLVSAWGRRKSLAALSSIGWAAIVLGGFSVGLSKNYPGLAKLSDPGWGGIGLGGILILLFSSEHPFNLAPKALLSRLLHGLKGFTEISKAFGDVLSYLRLFALGLASIKLGESFNSLASGSMASRGVGLLLGLVILIVGHTINFSMGIMSGVVHGLRLNLIEFFNWSLPEEGERFKTFARKARG
ncbi:MAG: V-type ATP synthase subunit I [Thermodesulfovibrionales bacterium]|jgi:V/A-type H+-transporting ATPase subunit I